MHTWKEEQSFHSIDESNKYVNAHFFSLFRFYEAMDRALLQRHTKKLYDNLGREEANILAQIRTGKTRVNSYL